MKKIKRQLFIIESYIYKIICLSKLTKYLQTNKRLEESKHKQRNDTEICTTVEQNPEYDFPKPIVE